MEGRTFRWSLPARRPRYRWDEPQPQKNGCTLTVQEDSESPGRVAQCRLSWTDGTPVTPEAIAIVVRAMIAAGWDPSARGPAFRLERPIDVGDLDVGSTRIQLAREVVEG